MSKTSQIELTDKERAIIWAIMAWFNKPGIGTSTLMAKLYFKGTHALAEKYDKHIYDRMIENGEWIKTMTQPNAVVETRDSNVLQILKRRIYHGKSHQTQLSDLKLASKEILDWVDDVIATSPLLHKAADDGSVAPQPNEHSGSQLASPASPKDTPIDFLTQIEAIFDEHLTSISSDGTFEGKGYIRALENKIVELFATHQAAIDREARIDELSNVQLEHGRYVTQTFVNGQAMTIEERITDLKALYQTNKGEES